MNLLLRLVLTSLLLTLAPRVGAHAIGVSQGDYTPSGATLHADLGFARGELALAIPALDTDADGTLNADELETGASSLRAALNEGVVVQRGGQSCRVESMTARLGEADGVVIGVDYACADGSDEWQLRFALLDRLTLGHRHLATVRAESGDSHFVLHGSQAELRIAAGDAAVDQGFVAMIGYGVEHILTGYDHLVFVLGLVLLGGRKRDLLWTVTAFTVAHSITLAAAALQWFSPSPSLVEPLIALTIAWVGVENWIKVDSTRRWRLSLVFGLIHGFGFAGALGEAAIPAERIPASLLAFNLGVEAGQLLVLAAVVPALYAVRRLRFAAQGVTALNGAIVLAGLVWFVQRVAGF